MNERIKELVNECKGDPKTSAFEPYFDKEKFAELIVKECANFIDSKLEMTEYSHEVVSWADGDDLKEHFGVKE